jgi:hypothetical protein
MTQVRWQVAQASWQRTPRLYAVIYLTCTNNCPVTRKSARCQLARPVCWVCH